MTGFYNPFIPEPELTDMERLRRVIRLCTSFVRNIAFHRAGMDGEVQRVLLSKHHRHSAFWRECHANFIDTSVLEWCKLFADRKGKNLGEHHWRRLVSDPIDFERNLFAYLQIAPKDFELEMKRTRHYRDKFVAHLDGERRMYIPKMEIHYSSVKFLHSYIISNFEITEEWTDLQMSKLELEKGYEQSLKVAQNVYLYALQT